MSQGSMFDDLGGLFDTNFGKKGEKKPEKAPPWKAKQIDGEYYVSLGQVLDLLEMNDVLPAVQKGLKRRIKPDG